jgi:hypothetical protein
MHLESLHNAFRGPLAGRCGKLVKGLIQARHNSAYLWRRDEAIDAPVVDGLIRSNPSWRSMSRLPPVASDREATTGHARDRYGTSFVPTKNGEY